MIHSASILPVVEELGWARAVAPSDSMSPVNLSAPVDVAAYCRRDQELAYRDLILGALLTQVVIRVGDVWQFSPPRPQLPATVSGELKYSIYDSVTPQPPGSVTHVTNSSIAKDAILTDQGLYARDLVLHEALRQAASVLVESPLTPLVSNMPASDAWSLAEGARARLASVGFNLPLDVALFKTPDADLAARDNQLAAFIAQLQTALSNIFARASRLHLKVPGQEPETYVLTTDTEEERIWSAYPQLPNGRLQVRYDRVKQTLTWLGEEPVASNPVPQDLTVPVAGGDLNIIGSLPNTPDAEYYRQKAARLHTRNYVDRIIFQTSAPELYLTNGGVYQPSSVLLPVPGQLLFSLPIVIPSGCARIGLLVQPSRIISLLGFLNNARRANGTAVNLTPDPISTEDLAAGTFTLSLPRGRSLLQLDITDLTAATPAFELEITLDGEVVFDGAFTFNRAPGTSVVTQAFEVNFEPEDGAGHATETGSATLVVRWLGGAGQLTLNRLLFTTPAIADQALTYSLQAQLGPNRPTTAVELSGVPERQDVVWFDTLVPQTLINPTFGVTFRGGQHAALYLHAYDVRVFDVRAALPNPSAYEPHKMALALNALKSVQGAWSRALLTSPLDPRTNSESDNPVWDAPANARWTAMLVTAGERRLETAFTLAGPGDIGRPALVPEGLGVSADGITVNARLPLPQLRPVFRALQAWMLEFSPRIAGPDFWPQSDAGCASDGALSATVVTANFDWALTMPSEGTGYITSLTSVSQLQGAPNGTSFTAYSIPNAGPVGGVLQQTVTLTATLANLNIGATYTVTIALDRQLLSGGAFAPYTAVVSVTATAASMSVQLPTIVAPDGYQAFVRSVILS